MQFDSKLTFLNPYLLPLQKLLVAYRKKIEFLFLLTEVGLFGLVVILGFASKTEVLSFTQIYEIGKKFGVIALYWYSLSLLPGMISRYRVAPLFGSMLMLFRRHFGIMMFLSAVVHYSLTTVFPIIIYGNAPFFDLPRTLGFLAFFIAMLLWITSNNFSEKKLGKWWKRIHRLTYVILLLIFGHVVLFLSDEALPAAVLIGLEMGSWFVFWRRKRVQAAASSIQQSM